MMEVINGLSQFLFDGKLQMFVHIENVIQRLTWNQGWVQFAVEQFESENNAFLQIQILQISRLESTFMTKIIEYRFDFVKGIEPSPV